MWLLYGFLNIKNLSVNVDIQVFAGYDNKKSVEMMLQKDG